MLYSFYYRESLSKKAKPTTQADQAAAVKAKKPKAVKVEAPKAEPEKEPEAIEADEPPKEVDRVAELMDKHTVSELREIAKGMGLTVPGRAKEKSIAELIASSEAETKEQ